MSLVAVTAGDNEYIFVDDSGLMVVLREATLAVTYRCNSRCSMCNIWRTTDYDELGPQDFRNLPLSLKTINLTGGEPFLRQDIVQIITAIHSVLPKSRIVISTNGLKTDKILSSVKDALSIHSRIGVGVSIDGIGEVHDSIRGVPGAFENSVETLRRLRAIGLNDLRIGMTILPENVHQMFDVYNLSKRLGVEFTSTIAHNSEVFFKKTDNRPPASLDALNQSVSKIIDDYLSSFSVKSWLRAYHLWGVMNESVRQKGRGKCGAGSRFVFIDPAGTVYPCLVLNCVMGNICDGKPGEDAFSLPGVVDVSKVVKNCMMDCWMVCNTRSLMMSHPLPVVYWVAKNRLKAFVR